MDGNLYRQLMGDRQGSSDTAFSEPGRSPLSYRDLDRLVAQMANGLTSIGLKPGDRVAVQVEKSVESIALYLATIRVGAVFLPLNTSYTRHEIEYFLSDSHPTLFVCDPLRESDLASAVNGNKTRCLTLDDSGSGTFLNLAHLCMDGFDTVHRAADDLAAILYTSGTTGRSKGAMLTHENLGSNARTLTTLWRIDQNDVLIHALPTYHLHGLFTATNTLLLAGGRMIFLKKFTSDGFFSALPEASLFMGVPTFYTRLLQDTRLDDASTAHMRLFISGSAPLLAEVHARWSEMTGHPILERYGMTETSMIASNPYAGERRAGTVGFPLPGVEVRITDRETTDPLQWGSIGMIEVRGPNVFKGYWGMPEKTASEFRSDGYFVTGDLGLIDEFGYLHIVGRDKDLIITGGFNVYPKEIEIEIDGLEGVEECAVVGIPHPDFGEAVTAVVVPALDRAPSIDEIQAALAARLAKYKLPKAIILRADLPRNAMGKVQKNVIRKELSELYHKGD